MAGLIPGDAKSSGTCCPYQSQTVEAPFRICFVVEPNGDVIPLQQCTDLKFEEEHTVTAWLRDPRSLVGFWEPTPVSKQLDQVLSSFETFRGQLNFVTNLDHR